MLIKTLSIKCIKKGCCKIFEFKVFNNIIKSLNIIVVIAIKLLLNLV
jgi:hypothetical protein